MPAPDPTTKTARSRETLGLLLGFVGVVIFGATLPMTRLAVRDLDPWFVTSGRAALAAVMAAVLLLVLRRPLPSRANLGRLAIVALMVGWGFPMFMALAMRTVPAGHGGVILAILPLATAIAATFVSGERPSGMFWLASIVGAALVTAFALRHSSGGVEAGHLYLVLAAASAATGYALSGLLSRSLPPWEVISWALVLTLLPSGLVAILTRPAVVSTVGIDAWGAFFYLAAMSQYLGFFAWNAGLALGGVAKVGQVQLLQTFVTLAISALMLGEPIDGVTLLFALAVVGVVLLARQAAVRRV